VYSREIICSELEKTLFQLWSSCHSCELWLAMAKLHQFVKNGSSHGQNSFSNVNDGALYHVKNMTEARFLSFWNRFFSFDLLPNWGQVCNAPLLAVYQYHLCRRYGYFFVLILDEKNLLIYSHSLEIAVTLINFYTLYIT